MSGRLWARRPVPPDGGTGARLWRSAPASAEELVLDRAELRAALLGTLAPAGPSADDVDRLLLVYEELGSNGLRHGRPPVHVEVVGTAAGWVLVVSDAAAEDPPVPAVGRDAAQGGLGLYLIARISAAHGWGVAAGRKHVWARVDFAAAP
jgi:hypothetical protein